MTHVYFFQPIHRSLTEVEKSLEDANVIPVSKTLNRVSSKTLLSTLSLEFELINFASCRPTS